MRVNRTSKPKIIFTSKPKVRRARGPTKPPPKLGVSPNDIEVLLGRRWVVVSSIRETEYDSVYWKSSSFTGNCPSFMWRYHYPRKP